MRSPDFWARSQPDWRARLLSPLGALYSWGTQRRLAAKPGTRLNIPVICVGNINAGGTGKTPTVIALVEKLHRLHFKPHIVSRGYGGTLKGPIEVNPARHRAHQVGDEPLLLSAFARCWVSKDRLDGAHAAIQAGADIIVFDDGFQDPAVQKDLSIIVVDAQIGFGNGLCIPAGPLREPERLGLKRADLLLSIGPANAQKRFHPVFDGPHLRAALKPLQTGMDWAGLKVIAFAGIGRPEKFFNTLSELGAQLHRCEALGDHEPLRAALMHRLLGEARRAGAQLVTTEKDAARLPPQYRHEVLTLPVRLEFEDDVPLDAALHALSGAKSDDKPQL